MYTLESYQNKINALYPEEKIKILSFNGVKGKVVFLCETCGETSERARGEILLKKRKTVCLNCNKGYSTQEIRDEYSKKIASLIEENSESLEILENFEMVTKNIKIKCLRCGEIFYRKPDVFLKTQKCPFCDSRKRKKTQNVFISDLQNKYGDEYNVLEEYDGAYKKILVRHSCGYEYQSAPHNLLNGKGCPKCSTKISKGEKRINEVLLSMDIDFIFQKSQEIDNSLLYFDFFVPSLSLFIEYQGGQHYFPVEYFGGEENFNKQIARDEAKRKYCNSNNYNLLEISYLDFDKIENIISSEVQRLSRQGVGSSEPKQ